MANMNCVVDGVAYKLVPERDACDDCAGRGRRLCWALGNCSRSIDESLPYTGIWVVDTDTPKPNQIPLLIIDWSLLRRQKEYLLTKAALAPVKAEEEMLDGVIHLIDALQDYAVSAGLADSDAVFPSAGNSDE